MKTFQIVTLFALVAASMAFAPNQTPQGMSGKMIISLSLHNRTACFVHSPRSKTIMNSIFLDRVDYQGNPDS
jgi:hypothetical protein